MAVINTATRDQIKVVYKTEYDTIGDFPQLTDYSQTFSYVKELATLEQKKALADAIMGLTIYRGAPYKVQQITTSTLVVS